MISFDLKVLANRLEKEADSVLKSVEDDPEKFQQAVEAVALASMILENASETLNTKQGFTAEQLDEIVALANEFDRSGDEFLVKQASALTDLLMTIATQKDAIAQSSKTSDDELARLHQKYHSQKREEYYKKPKELLDEWNQAKQTVGAVDKIKKYEPMEAPLQTRYSPDYPGQSMTRISDGIYQDPITGKIYDFKTGYTTNKGNKIPGGAVENQAPDVGSGSGGHTLFSTREGILNRYTSEDHSDKTKKTG